MNVYELIKLLEKVKDKLATVYIRENATDHEAWQAVIEHDLADDEICVVLKGES